MKATRLANRSPTDTNTVRSGVKSARPPELTSSRPRKVNVIVARKIARMYRVDFARRK